MLDYAVKMHLVCKKLSLPSKGVALLSAGHQDRPLFLVTFPMSVSGFRHLNLNLHFCDAMWLWDFFLFFFFSVLSYAFLGKVSIEVLCPRLVGLFRQRSGSEILRISK